MRSQSLFVACSSLWVKFASELSFFQCSKRRLGPGSPSVHTNEASLSGSCYMLYGVVKSDWSVENPIKPTLLDLFRALLREAPPLIVMPPRECGKGTLLLTSNFTIPRM